VRSSNRESFVRQVQLGSFELEVTLFSGTQPTVITAFTELYKVLWGGAMSNIVRQSAQFELDSAQHWKPVELLQKSYVAHVFV